MSLLVILENPIDKQSWVKHENLQRKEYSRGGGEGSVKCETEYTVFISNC